MRGYCWRVVAVWLVVGIQLMDFTTTTGLSLDHTTKDCSTRREWCRATTLGLSSSLLLGTGSAQAATGPRLLPEYDDPSAITTAPDQGRFYFPTLTPPFANRATYRYNLGRNAWALEQLLAFANVTATIRTNVVKLEQTGGLWVHSPQWPTGEFCHLLDDLDGSVEHVVLPCNALEHKAPMQAFLKRYPQAQVWIAPGQYGLFGTCGLTTKDKINMGYRVDGILAPGNLPPPWADEFDMATLYVDLPQNAGPVSEVAFCHKPSRTLIATDAVVYIPSGRAPEIFSTYFDDQASVDDSTFWPRSVLQSVFLPLRQDPKSGTYPGFEAIKDRLVRAPILRAFADARAPVEVKAWIDQISAFDFDRIVTSHFASPIGASPSDFRAAYGYLDDRSNSRQLPPIACQDWELLEGLNRVIAENNLGAPAVYDYKKGCL